MSRRRNGRISLGKLGLGWMTCGLSFLFTGVREDQSATRRQVRRVRAGSNHSVQPPAPRVPPVIVRKDLDGKGPLFVLQSDGMKWYIPKLSIGGWVAVVLVTLIILLNSMQMPYLLLTTIPIYLILVITGIDAVLFAKPYLKIGVPSRYEGDYNWEFDSPDTDDSQRFTIQKVDAMEGHEFEHFIAELLNALAYENVSVTRGSGDQGVDVLAELNGIRYAIQCKNYSSALGNTPVQEVSAGKEFYGCHVGVVVTNNVFTAGGKALAERVRVILWDRAELCKMIDRANLSSRP